MRIFINCIGTMPLFNKSGGAIQKVTSLLVRNLLKNKDNQIIVAGRMVHNEWGIKHIKCTNIPFVDSPIRLIFYGIMDFFKAMFVNADIVIATHQRNVLSSFLWSRFRNKPLICWEHDHTFWTLPITDVKKLYHRIVSRATKVVATSSVQKERMISYGVDKDKIVLIHYAVDIDKYAPLPADRKKQDNYICYAGKFSGRKNQLVLLEAFYEVSHKLGLGDINLHLAGPFGGAYAALKDQGDPYYQQCKQYINKMGLEGKVKIDANLESDALVEFYRNAALFVIPSKEEGFGLVLLEAMLCGCACLINDIEPLTEVLGQSGHKVDAMDIKKLTAAMERLLLDKGLRDKLGNAARNRVKECFTADILGKKFNNLLKELITDNRKG